MKSLVSFQGSSGYQLYLYLLHLGLGLGFVVRVRVRGVDTSPQFEWLGSAMSS